jgi:hypothetical protein
MADGVHGLFTNVTGFATVIRGDVSESATVIKTECGAEVIRGGNADSDNKEQESNR